jgi:hypothetical protein
LVAGQAISFVLELVKDYFWNLAVTIVYHISSQETIDAWVGKWVIPCLKSF